MPRPHVVTDTITIAPLPRTWSMPVRLNEDALADAVKIREEEDSHLRTEDEDDEGDDE